MYFYLGLLSLAGVGVGAGLLVNRFFDKKRLLLLVMDKIAKASQKKSDEKVRFTVQLRK